jgi:hypothetical protein
MDWKNFIVSHQLVGNCPKLTNIPQQTIQKLLKLNCSNCPLLTSIPYQSNETDDPPGLKKLTVFSYHRLQELNCSNCRLLTDISQKHIDGLEVFNFDGCIWLESNNEYEKSINKLKLLQSWFKNILQSRRLKKLIQRHQLVGIGSFVLSSRCQGRVFTQSRDDEIFKYCF